MFSLAVSTMAWAATSAASAGLAPSACPIALSAGTRRLGIERDLAAQEIVRVRAGRGPDWRRCRRLGAALAVAHRAGIGAGAARSDLEQPALVDPGDTAAARAERGDIDAGHGNGDAEADLELAQVALLPPWIVPISALVPPMSSEKACSTPASRA